MTDRLTERASRLSTRVRSLGSTVEDRRAAHAAANEIGRLVEQARRAERTSFPPSVVRRLEDLERRAKERDRAFAHVIGRRPPFGSEPLGNSILRRWLDSKPGRSPLFSRGPNRLAPVLNRLYELEAILEMLLERNPHLVLDPESRLRDDAESYEQIDKQTLSGKFGPRWARRH